MEKKHNGIEALARELDFIAKKYKVDVKDVTTNFFGYMREEYSALQSIYFVNVYYELIKNDTNKTK